MLLESEEELRDGLFSFKDDLERLLPKEILELDARLGGISSGCFLNHSLSSGLEPVRRSEDIQKMLNEPIILVRLLNENKIIGSP